MGYRPIRYRATAPALVRPTNSRPKSHAAAGNRGATAPDAARQTAPQFTSREQTTARPPRFS
eukprot:14673960-Alexandrium_andersonii.AAC.1